MASFKTGILTMRTTDGDDTIALGDVGKFVRLWATLNTSNGSIITDAIYCEGISDGNNHGGGVGEFSVANAIQDNQATPNANRYQDNKALVLVDNTDALICSGTAAFSGNNLVITWDWVAGGTAYLIHYFVVCGSEVQCKVINSFTAGTSAGAKSYSGFGFAPDAFYALAGGDENAAPHARANANFVWGAAKNGTSRYQATGGFNSEDNVADANCVTSIRNDYALNAWSVKAGIFSSNGAMTMQVAVGASWDSDGFTGVWQIAAGNAWIFGCAGFKGLQYDIAIDLMPTSTGDDSQSGSGFQPGGMMHWTTPVISGHVQDDDVNFAVGALTSASDEHACWVGDDDAQATSKSHMVSSGISHVIGADPNNTAGGVDVRADLVSLNASAPEFVQNFSTVRATANYQGWMAFGVAGAGWLIQRDQPARPRTEVVAY